MTNSLGYYNPVFYAQEALIQLEKALGMAGTVYRGYERERNAFRRGDTINIRRPSTFTAADAPATAADLEPDSVQMTLAYWREVKFKLTDKELALTSNVIIDEHIRPAAVALADDIDLKLNALYKDIPWYYDLNASPGSVVTDLTGPHKVLFDNRVPMDPSMLWYETDSTLQAGLLANSAFAQWQGSGQRGVDTQVRGMLGQRYGFNFFGNQNTSSHTAGTLSDTTPILNGAHAKGATTVNMDDTSLTGTLVAGDTFVIAGNTQRYAVTALATASANAITVTVTPPLVQAYSDAAAVTVRLDSHTANLAYHRNAFALAMAPLSEMGNELGAKIASVQDPITGLALRSRLYYVGNSSEVHVALDVLYGVKTLDPNLAVRCCG